MKYASTHQPPASAPTGADTPRRDRHMAQPSAAAVSTIPTVRGFGQPAATTVEIRTIVAGRANASHSPNSDRRAADPAAQVTIHQRLVAVPDTKSCWPSRWTARQ